MKDMADLMEGGREEGWEKSMPSKQVTFLVYREGDQLNFFRVVDRGDGTLTPVSESLRSVVNNNSRAFYIHETSTLKDTFPPSNTLHISSRVTISVWIDIIHNEMYRLVWLRQKQFVCVFP